ncbi:cytochrome c oxidase polypeptide vib-like protein [Xylaria sp. FL0043]|nr:cytochrome c oxidase polypeptide vib-like protein [Xylaria sp. FL0043]
MSDEEREVKPFKFVTGRFILQFTSSFIIKCRFTSSSGFDETALIISLAGVDARFPNQNQTKHCWQNYVDYHKCINAKGEDFAPCRQFYIAYRSLCPSGWYQRWDDQREAGNFPAKLDA